MNNEHTFAQMPGTGTYKIFSGDPSHSTGGCDAEKRITLLLDDLDRVVTDEILRSHTADALGLLGRLRTRVSSHMCDLMREAAAANPDVDTAEVLRQKARMSGRDAKRMARVAERLYEMPRMAEKFAAGDITFDHAVALVNAADRVGAGLVEADPTLLALATSPRVQHC